MGPPSLEILIGGSVRLVNPFPPSSKGAELFLRIEPSLGSLDLVRHSSNHSRGLVDELLGVTIEDLLGCPIGNPDMAQAVKAGLLLAIDAWEEAHSVAQDLDTIEGSYWHGIVHRREPDAGNARYWFHRVGNHPVFQHLAGEHTSQGLPSLTAFAEINSSGTWDPLIFIDLCESCVRVNKPELKAELQALQTREIQLLLQHCVQEARCEGT